MFRITSIARNINAVNLTIGNVNHFNELFRTDDCVVVQVPDPTPEELDAQRAQLANDLAIAKENNIILNKKIEKREDYLDAVLKGDTKEIENILVESKEIFVESKDVQ